MKKLTFIIAIIALIATQKVEAADRISFGVFYSSLTPYGEWIELEPDFYVWRPIYVRHNWRPYMNGRWAWTSYGWYWVSYEPFGWATFHYGRWYYDDYYGWIWIPGYEWAPAWVEWRYNDDYIGWAPLPPYAVFRVSIGIHFTTRWYSPAHYWSFVRYRNFCNPRVVDYYVPLERSRRFFGDTRYRTDYGYDNNRIVNRGIDREVIERRSGDRIRTAEIIEVRDRQTERIVREGDRPRIEVYRPSDSDAERMRPERIEARRSDRKASLDLEKVERPDREFKKDRNLENQQQREIYRTESRKDDKNVETRKSAEKYRPEDQRRNEPNERRIEERKGMRERRFEVRKEKQSREVERKPEVREERQRRDVEKRPEYKPDRREREIEIRKEQVKPREYREEPRQERSRDEGRREGSSRERPRNRE